VHTLPFENINLKTFYIMLKNISSLGTTLSKKEQEVISGGFNRGRCNRNSDCYCEYIGPGDTYCGSNGYCQFW
jgi:hypothetical protein